MILFKHPPLCLHYFMRISSEIWWPNKAHGHFKVPDSQSELKAPVAMKSSPWVLEGPQHTLTVLHPHFFSFHKGGKELPFTDFLLFVPGLKPKKLHWSCQWSSCCSHCSVTQSCPTLWPHGLQHTRLHCPPLSPEVCPNSCLLSRWCHPNISFSVVPFSSRLQSFSASRSLPMSRLFP